jgi:mono/diheme cytochrome c family protein
MSEESHDPETNEPEYGPTYYAPVEMPIPRLPRPPFWMIALALVMVVVTWLPLAIIARARVSLSSEPRIQIMQDMGIQPKFREQEINTLFEDDRAMRPHIPGTVARGSLEPEEQDNYYHGFVRQNDGSGKWTVVFADSLPQRLYNSPKGVKAGMKALLARGQQRFNIYCYVCHGYDGSGRGPVNQRAMELKAIDTDPQHPLGMNWTPAAQITSDVIRAEPDGKIFNTITNGIRTMPSYGAQIPVDDRWAIVAYVRALQLSQGGVPTADLNQKQLDALQGQ